MKITVYTKAGREVVVRNLSKKDATKIANGYFNKSGETICLLSDRTTYIFHFEDIDYLEVKSDGAVV